MKISFDFDNTLADNSKLYKLLYDTCKVKKKYPTDYNFKDDNKEVQDTFKGILSSNIQTKQLYCNRSYVKLFSYTKKILKSLLNDGHELYVISSRICTEYNHSFIYDTLSYIKKENIILTKNKANTIKEFGIDIHIDDWIPFVDDVIFQTELVLISNKTTPYNYCLKENNDLFYKYKNIKTWFKNFIKKDMYLLGAFDNIMGDEK